ncbi:HAD family hydrolase [Mucilaginibacter myungsuensis]|uniref:HAD family phosphatase n=1 Tax=Mucilaginibacter myungsuensis TaxID=649104 RepID=A0A929KV92_9SPHI|nr:HAD family phosphatase [Mucilaginibacter myungsuensis]MBE9661382.1 HAD family phosphatase [Mucilaginibacter myungsuensis]MDN3597525.1 HAD family phosphatase [Mucilaginibacter myungsuensis]
MQHPYKAFIFDLNGTMVNDMEFHQRAWTDILNNELGGNFSDAEIKQNMYGKNPEVLVRMFGKGKFTDEEMEALSMKKEKAYQDVYLPHLRLVPGLQEFLDKAYAANIPMAIGSAAIPFNINFVLDNLNIRKYFKAIVSANEVEVSKPHPETFLKAAEQMMVSPADCLVFEDVPKGAETAKNAGMPCVILTTTHHPEEFAGMDNVIHLSPDLTGEFFDELIK